MPITVKDILGAIPGRFNAEAAGDWKAAIQFNFSTEGDDENWLHHSLCHFDPAGPRLGTKEVTLGKWEPVERKY